MLLSVKQEILKKSSEVVTKKYLVPAQKVLHTFFQAGTKYL